MADQPSPELIKALVERYASRPMPEEYDKPEALGTLTPHLRAFGAGLADPMGVPSWLVNKLAANPTTDWYERRMQEARDESPVAAGMGSAIPMVSGAMTAQAIRNAPAFARLGLSVWPAFAKDFVTMPPAATGIGAVAGRVREFFSPPNKKQRPQGSYPPDGAY